MGEFHLSKYLDHGGRYSENRNHTKVMNKKQEINLAKKLNFMTCDKVKRMSTLNKSISDLSRRRLQPLGIQQKGINGNTNVDEGLEDCMQFKSERRGRTGDFQMREKFYQN